MEHNLDFYLDSYPDSYLDPHFDLDPHLDPHRNPHLDFEHDFHLIHHYLFHKTPQKLHYPPHICKISSQLVFELHNEHSHYPNGVHHSAVIYQDPHDLIQVYDLYSLF